MQLMKWMAFSAVALSALLAGACSGGSEEDGAALVETALSRRFCAANAPKDCVDLAWRIATNKDRERSLEDADLARERACRLAPQTYCEADGETPVTFAAAGYDVAAAADALTARCATPTSVYCVDAARFIIDHTDDPARGFQLLETSCEAGGARVPCYLLALNYFTRDDYDGPPERIAALLQPLCDDGEALACTYVERLGESN